MLVYKPNNKSATVNIAWLRMVNYCWFGWFHPWMLVLH